MYQTLYLSNKNRKYYNTKGMPVSNKAVLKTASFLIK
jgi:hypothetical protein